MHFRGNAGHMCFYVNFVFVSFCICIFLYLYPFVFASFCICILLYLYLARWSKQAGQRECVSAFIRQCGQMLSLAQGASEASQVTTTYRAQRQSANYYSQIQIQTQLQIKIQIQICVTIEHYLAIQFVSQYSPHGIII